MTDQRTPQPIKPQDEEMKEFLLVVRKGLLVVVRWIERKYEVGEHAPEKDRRAA